MKTFAMALTCASVLLLSSCATQIPWDGEMQSLRVRMTQGEVEAQLGSPNRTQTDANGLQVWVYERSRADGPDASSGATVTVTFVGGRATNISHSVSTTTTTYGS